MRFASLIRRLDALPFPVGADDGRAAYEAVMMHFPARLDELGLSDLIGEAKAAPGPCFDVVDEMSQRHPDLACRIQAAEILALSDALEDCGEDGERIKRIRQRAYDGLDSEVKRKQTHDGSDLNGWSYYTWQRDGQAMKLCRSCGGCVSTPTSS
jgi:hypothetical protein